MSPFEIRFAAKIITKKCVIKEKLKFENYKNCLETTQPENKINHLEKNKIDIDSLKKDHKEFIKNNKLTLKHSEHLKAKSTTTFLLKKLIRLL